jgi:hypothetical protein
MLPNLLIIGAMKCGTTSLHKYLNLHPEIYMHKDKELDFFLSKKNNHKNINWYKSKFIKKNKKILGESSPNYSKYPFFKGVPENIYKLIPNVKIIYIVKDPIKRLISHYKHNYSLGRNRKSFKQTLNNLDSSNKYLITSMYYMQLSQYLKYFPKSNIYVLDSDSLMKEQLITLQSIFEFLEVRTNVEFPKNYKKYHETLDDVVHNKLGIMLNKRGYDQKISRTLPKIIYYLFFQKKADIPIIDQEIIEKIKHHLSEDTNNFRVLTGGKFPNWCV